MFVFDVISVYFLGLEQEWIWSSSSRLGIISVYWKVVTCSRMSIEKFKIWGVLNASENKDQKNYLYQLLYHVLSNFIKASLMIFTLRQYFNMYIVHVCTQIKKLIIQSHLSLTFWPQDDQYAENSIVLATITVLFITIFYS